MIDDTSPKVSPSDRVRGYKVIGGNISAIPDVLYPWDPAVVKAIHEFDPNVIPLFAKIVYQTDAGGVLAYGFHMIGSHNPSPRMKVEGWVHGVLMPACGPIQRKPTHKDLDIRDRNEKKGPPYPGSGKYLPFDWRVYQLLRTMYNEWSAKQIAAYALETQGAAERKAREAAEANAEYALKTSGVERHLKNIDRHDIDRLAAKAIEAEKPRPSIIVP